MKKLTSLERDIDIQESLNLRLLMRSDKLFNENVEKEAIKKELG
jgi:hypothetical protein